MILKTEVNTHSHILLAVMVFHAILATTTLGQMPVTKVVVAKAEMRDLPATATLVGTINAVRRSRIGAQTGGIVVDMPVRQGDRVEAGQLLCRLNDDLISYELAAARAKLDSLKAWHEELVAGTREEVLARLKARVVEAQALRRRWGYERERMQRLYADTKAGSQKELYDAEAEYLAAQQRELAAKATYDEAKKGPRAEEVARAAYDVAEQQAIALRLETAQGKTRIQAPFAGFVVERVVEVGEWVSPGGQVVELADLSTVLVRVNVPESALAYCKVGEPVRVKVDAVGLTFVGKIKHVIPSADKATRTFPIDIELDNPSSASKPTKLSAKTGIQRTLAAGMFARVTVPTGPQRKAIAVPKDAIVDRRGTSYVAMVVPGERGMMGIPLPVTLGADMGGWVAITSGNVREGMAIIVRGNERIGFPQPVEIVDENGSPIK